MYHTKLVCAKTVKILYVPNIIYKILVFTSIMTYVQVVNGVNLVNILVHLKIVF